MLRATKTESKFLRRKKIGRISETPLHIMLIPGVVIMIIYAYLPMYGLKIAFEDFKPENGLFGPQTFVGLEHLNYFFSMPEFVTVMRNTLYIAVLKMLTQTFFPIFIALLLNEIYNHLTKRIIQTIVYLPHFLSWVILAGILNDVLSLDGIINQFLGIFGIKPVFFMGDNTIFPWTIVFTSLWKEFGWGTIIHLATLAGISPTLYEAALVDGANRWQQTWNVTLPGMAPIIVLCMVLALKNILNAGFNQVFNMYKPIVYESSEIIDTLVYRLGLIQARFGLSSAVGMFKSIISLIMIVSSYTLAYKLTGYRVW